MTEMITTILVIAFIVVATLFVIVFAIIKDLRRENRILHEALDRRAMTSRVEFCENKVSNVDNKLEALSNHLEISFVEQRAKTIVKDYK